MAWRPGEVWLEGDVRWFRESGGGAVAAVWVPPALPSFGPPPGLAASRARRQERLRRKRARKLRTAALVIAPAAVIPLAALRQHGGSSLVLDDPPSLTLRLAPTAVTKPAELPQPAQARTLSLTEEAPRATLAEPSYPPVVWHHATSVGLPWDGSLIDGTQFPVEGPGWVTWQPVTNTVPNDPDRLYGNERTVRALLHVIAAYHAANPGAPPVVVGDLSRTDGGPFYDEHQSHQNGLDVDVYYPRLDGRLSDPFTPANMDHRLSQDLVDLFVAAGAQMVLVGPDTGLTGPSGVVIPYPEHDNHMHVRFPPDS
jgi:hypothetical protein